MTGQNRFAVLLPLVLLAAACGPFGAKAPSSTSSPTASSTTSSTASPTPKQLLFAVVEAKGKDARLGGEPNVGSAYDTVAIVGTDGIARAKATFTARWIPVVGNAAPVLPAAAQIAAGSVFYADRFGVVRKLAMDGSTTTVTTFPVTDSQQEVAFAVSPDGQHLVASILTFPKLNPKRSDPSNTFLPPIEWKVVMEKADAGGSPQTLWTKTYKTVENNPMVAGWDSQGPVVMTNAQTGTQAGTNDRPYSGALARLDLSTGGFGTVVGGTGCNAWWELADTTTLCVAAPGNSGQIRSGGGAQQWSFPTLVNQNYVYPSGEALSPDGASVVVGGQSGTNAVITKSGNSTSLDKNFWPEGWLDQATVIGIAFNPNGTSQASQVGNLELINLSHPGVPQDLGFKGAFVGVVQTP